MRSNDRFRKVGHIGDAIRWVKDDDETERLNAEFNELQAALQGKVAETTSEKTETMPKQEIKGVEAALDVIEEAEVEETPRGPPRDVEEKKESKEKDKGEKMEEKEDYGDQADPTTVAGAHVLPSLYSSFTRSSPTSNYLIALREDIAELRAQLKVKNAHAQSVQEELVVLKAKFEHSEQERAKLAAAIETRDATLTGASFMVEFIRFLLTSIDLALKSAEAEKAVLQLTQERRVQGTT